MITERLLQKYPIISDQITRERLRIVLSEFEKALQVDMPGHVVEFGCYTGTTSLFLRRMLDTYDQSAKRELHVYDSFAGLPEKSSQDSSAAGDQFKAGELNASKKQLLHEFHKANLRPPIVHKGWFSELTPANVPNKIIFAFLDGDFYESITDSFRLVRPRLSPNGVITIDDYGREALPGAGRAVRDCLRDEQTMSLRVEHNIAVIKTNY